MTNVGTPRILITGGGHVGLYAADRLLRRLRPGEADLTLVEPATCMNYQPLLAEVAAGSVEPRHVAVPLRRAVPGVHIIGGQVRRLRHAGRAARVRLVNGEERELDYDHVVVAPGAVVRTAPVPGLAETAVGFRTISEAVFLRNHVLTQLALAASTTDPNARRRALTFVVVGGWFAGVEVVGELSDLAIAAIASFEGLRREDLRWILVEGGDRIMPAVSPELSAYTAAVLRERGVDIRLGTTVASCVAGRIRFAGRYAGDMVEADTLVWTSDIQPHPMLAASDLPRDAKGRLVADAYLRVRGTSGAWTAGDCAAVPDLTSDQPGVLCLPTAQHAIRQGRRLADNLVAELRHDRWRPPKPYRHHFAGAAAGLGRNQGVAQIYGVCLRGLPAWLVHRGYHLAKLPSAVRKTHVLTDWALSALFPRDISAPGELDEFRNHLQTVARAPSLSQPRKPGRTRNG